MSYARKLVLLRTVLMMMTRRSYKYSQHMRVGGNQKPHLSLELLNAADFDALGPLRERRQYLLALRMVWRDDADIVRSYDMRNL